MSSWGLGTVHSVHDMEIDEVSLVDRPANQHAAMLIAKSYQGADVTAPAVDEIEVFLADGTPVVDESELTEGQEIFGADGQRYTYTTTTTLEDDAEELEDDAEELGKSAGDAFRPGRGREVVGKSLAETFQEEIAKARTGKDVSHVIAKMSTALQEADTRASAAEQIAKSERDLRLDREYITKAAQYNVPIDPVELGPVLKRMAERMSYADCVVIDKALNASGQMLFTEIGFQGGGTPGGEDPMADANAYAEEQVAKGAGGGEPLSKAAQVEAFYNSNPQAYEDYLNSRRG